MDYSGNNSDRIVENKKPPFARWFFLMQPVVQVILG